MKTNTVRAGNFTIWQLILVVLWFGMVFAISFIEAPLKFQAPGITIPLGLGIGRLVFTALNIAEGVLLLLLLWSSLKPGISRVIGTRLYALVALTVIFVAKVAVVRPPLNARTDLVLQGADPGQSPWHYVYIALDVALLILLVIFALKTVALLKTVITQQKN